MRALGLGAAALMVAAAVNVGPARADRYTPYASPYAPMASYDWSGFYIGGQAGVAASSTQWFYTGTLDSPDQSAVSFAGGAQAGLQKQWGRLVVGVEAAYAWADLSETSASNLAANTSLTSSASNLLLVTGKLGYTWDNLLGYAKGGYASGDVEFQTGVRSSGLVTTTSSERESGWTAGLGVEYAVLPNIILGVEYDYVRLNVDGRDQTATPAGLAGSQVSDAGVDVQMVMARLSFKFGPRPEPLPPPIK